MRNLFEAARAEEVKRRLLQLQPDSERLWGKMSVTEMLAHCSVSLEMAMGQIRPRRLPIGRLIGWVIKPMVFREEEPMRRNSPTAKELLVSVDMKDFGKEKIRLGELIDCFAEAGPEGCTKHPHCFFGRLVPDEWAALMYKHLDHHLRQFGV